jgi:hypothetical protein
VNASGTAALPNEGGISVWTSSFNRVGGTQPGEANLISGNLQSAITIGGLNAAMSSSSATRSAWMPAVMQPSPTVLA